jgi:hypothetical protein
MSASRIRYATLLTGSVLMLAGCGSGMGGCNPDEPKFVPTSELATPTLSTAEPEGPQYQTPTVENLQGKTQLYPSKYPAKRYPNSRVVLAHVRPNLKVGSKNVVVLSTTDNPPVVTQYYVDQLQKDGYALTSTYSNSAFHRSLWKKGDHEVEVRVSPDPYGKQVIQLFSGPYIKVETYGLQEVEKKK